jgi:hypothetical protein
MSELIVKLGDKIDSITGQAGSLGVSRRPLTSLLMLLLLMLLLLLLCELVTCYIVVR